MNPAELPVFLQQPALVGLGLVLVHFVWQAVVVALVAAGALTVLRPAAPNVRYATGLAALAIMVLCPIATWPLVRDSAARMARAAAGAEDEPMLPVGGAPVISSAAASEDADAPVSAAITPHEEAPDRPFAAIDERDWPTESTAAVDVPRARGSFDDFPEAAGAAESPPEWIEGESGGDDRAATQVVSAPVTGEADVGAGWPSAAGPLAAGAPEAADGAHWRGALLGAAAAGWIAGVTFMALRLLASGLALRKLRRGALPLDPALAAGAARLHEVLGLRRAVAVRASAGVGEPMAFGFFRPVVLLPAAFLLQCPVAVAETIIAHELAHIRRGDLWINALQRVVEALFFFHPGVLWLSGRIRLERELCCDDAAIAATGARAAYASGLLAVAEWRVRPAGALFAAGVLGGRTSMSARIRRVLGEPVASSPRGGWQGAVLVAMGLVAFVTAPYLRAADEPATESAAESGDTGGADMGIIDASTTSFPPRSALAELRNFPPEGPLNWPEECGLEEAEREVPATSLVQNRVGEEGADSAAELDGKRAALAEKKLVLEPATRAGRALHVLRAALLDRSDAEASRRFRPHDGKPASMEQLAQLRRDLELLGIDLAGTVPWTVRVAWTVDASTVVVVSSWFEGPTRPPLQVELLAQVQADERGNWYVEQMELLGDEDKYWVERKLSKGVYFASDGRMNRHYSRGLDECLYQFKAFASLKDRRRAQEAMVGVHALTDGVISEVSVNDGDVVKKGDLLVKLDSAEIELGLATVNVRYESAREKHDVAKVYLDKGLGPAEEYRSALEFVRLAEIELQQWQLRLDRTHIRSPVDGVVMLEAIEAGQLVTRGQKVASVRTSGGKSQP